MDGMLLISAVILSYNRRDEVLTTIEKLKQQMLALPFHLEIVVVDNASVDDTSLMISRLHPDAVLVTKKKNNGIAGWNEGFKAARGKYMLVLDDDSCIESGLAESVNFLEANERTGILALNIVDTNLKGDPHLREEDAWKDGEDIVGFIGCGAIIRKELYDRIGGFAEWIYLYTHEFEYSIRCLNAGYHIRFFEKGLVVHRTSAINRSKKNMRIFAVRNEMAIIYKYFSRHRFKYILRTFFNNLKFMKREGLCSGYYILLGTAAFVRLRKKIGHTPVDAEIQNFYSKEYWSAKPVLTNVKRRLRLN